MNAASSAYRVHTYWPISNGHHELRHSTIREMCENLTSALHNTAANAPVVPGLPQEHEARLLEVDRVGSRDADVSHPEGKSK